MKKNTNKKQQKNRLADANTCHEVTSIEHLTHSNAVDASVNLTHSKNKHTKRVFDEDQKVTEHLKHASLSDINSMNIHEDVIEDEISPETKKEATLDELFPRLREYLADIKSNTPQKDRIESKWDEYFASMRQTKMIQLGLKRFNDIANAIKVYKPKKPERDEFDIEQAKGQDFGVMHESQFEQQEIADFKRATGMEPTLDAFFNNVPSTKNDETEKKLEEDSYDDFKELTEFLKEEADEMKKSLGDADE